ncbi:hypothetical protein ABZ646_30435, partial [Streptomyces sp. NPDC007162]
CATGPRWSTGADVAGEPSHDPLEQPIAGQLLSNIWNRPVWTTGSGDEPVLAVSAPELGLDVRFQLAEGDWWAGFKPEPSTAQLGRMAEQVTGDRGRAGDVLRWVRAIRMIYGPPRKDDAAPFEALLHGFWALERWRSGNGDGQPLTWAHLRSLITRHHAATGRPEPELAQALPALLASAADAVGTALPLHGPPLAPRHQSRLSVQGAESATAARMAGAVTSLFGPRITSSPAYRSLLTAVVTARRLTGGSQPALQALARQALRLGPTAPVGPEQMGALLTLLARATALGRAGSMAELHSLLPSQVPTRPDVAAGVTNRRRPHKRRGETLLTEAPVSHEPHGEALLTEAPVTQVDAGSSTAPTETAGVQTAAPAPGTAQQTAATGAGSAASVFPAVHAPRFPRFFTQRSYRSRSESYGIAAARALANDPLVLEHAQQALGRIVERSMNAPGGMSDDFQKMLYNRPSLKGFDADAEQQRLFDPDNPPPFKDVMGALERVVARYAWENGLAGPVGVRLRDAAWDAEMRRRGYHGSRELTSEQRQQARDIELMLRVHQHLGQDAGDAFMFRDAVAGWYLSRPDALPWEWFLDVSHRAGVWDEQVEPDPWLTDMSRVHGWMHGELDPLGRPDHGNGVPEVLCHLPHVEMYAERTAPLLSDEVTGLGEWVNPGPVLVRALNEVAGLTGAAADLWRQRREALRDVLRDPGTLRALRRLSRGHSMALALVSGPDARFFEPAVLREGPRALDRLRELIRKEGGEADPEDRSTWPLLMLRDSAVRAVIGRSAPPADVAAVVEDFVDQFVDERLLAEVRGHASMAEEALDTLPSKPADGRSALYIRTAPGALFGGAKPYAVPGQEIPLEAFEAGSTDRAAALQELNDRLEGAEPGTRHGVVLEAVRPLSSRETSVWSLTPRKRTVQSPRAMRLRTLGRTYGRDGKSGLWYEHIVATEVPEPTSNIAWDNEILVRDIHTPDGVWFGYASHTSRDMVLRRRTYSRFPHMTQYRVKDSRKGTYGPPRPWPLPSGTEPRTGKPEFVMSAAHGLPDSVLVVGRFGPKLLSGTQSGAESARRLAEAGVADGTPLLQWQCSVGSRRPGLPSVAQQAVDEHPPQRDSFAGTTQVGYFSDGRDDILLRPGWGAAPGVEFVKVQPRDLPRADAPAPSAEPYFAGQAARYPAGVDEFFEHAAIYEAALGQRLSEDPASSAIMRQVVRAIADSGRFQVAVDPGRPGVPLDDLIDITRAAADASYPAHAAPLIVDPSVQQQLARERGIRLAQAPSTRGMYWLYQDLDLPAEHFPAFVRAVFGWGLSRRHPLAALLSDLHTSETSGNQAALTAALAGNGPHLYGLADAMFAPRDGLPAGDLADRLRPPHWRMHTEGMSWLAAAPDGVQVPQGLMRAVRLLGASEDVPSVPAGERSQLGADTWADRHAAARDWNDGSLDRLDPAHVIALYLLSHDGNRRILGSGADELSFAEGAARLEPLVRQEIDDAVHRARHGHGPYLPPILRHPIPQGHADRMAAVPPGTPAFAAVRRDMLHSIPSLAQVLRFQLPINLGLAAEGLAARPPVDRTVYFAFEAPTAGAAASLTRLNVRQFERVEWDPAAALGSLSGKAPRVLVAVEKSTARDVTAVAHDPSVPQIRYAAATDLEVLSYQVRVDSDGTSYEMLRVKELPSADPREALDAVRAVATAAEAHIALLPGSAAVQSPADLAHRPAAVAGTSQAPHADSPPVPEEQAGSSRDVASTAVPSGEASAEETRSRDGDVDTADAGTAEGSALAEPQTGGAAGEAAEQNERDPEFPAYDGPEAESARWNYDVALGRAIASDPKVGKHARMGLRHLSGLLKAAHPTHYRRLFFAPENPANAHRKEEMRRLLSTRNPAPLEEVMDAFAQAAPVYAQDNGIAAAPLPELVLRVYQHMDVPDGDELFFRDAVLGWLLPRGGHSLAQLLAMTQQAVRDEAEPDATQINEARLYGWASAMLDPKGRVSAKLFAADPQMREALERLPHETLYHRQTADLLTQEVTGEPGTSKMITVLVGGMAAGVATSAEADAVRQRREAYRWWLRHHRVTAPLRPVQPGHVVALHLAGGPDAAFFAPEIIRGGPQALHRLREMIRSFGDKLAGGAPRSDMPSVLLEDPRISRLADQPPEQRSGQRVRAAFAEAARSADDGMVQDMARHAAMAVEGLRLLPEYGGSVFFPLWRPGPLHGQHDYATEGWEFQADRFFRSPTNREVPLEELARSAGHKQGHPVMVEVLRSSSRLTAMLAREPRRGEAQYAAPVRFRFKQYTLTRDMATGLDYAHVTVVEVPQPIPAEPWNRQIITRWMTTSDKRRFGVAAFTTRDWNHRKRTYPHLLSGAGFSPLAKGRTPETGEQAWSLIPETVSRPQAAGMGAFFWASHGSPHYFKVPSPYGLRRAGGTEVGRIIEQHMDGLGLPKNLAAYVWSCSAGRERPGAAQLAKFVAGVQPAERETIAATSELSTTIVRGTDPSVRFAVKATPQVPEPEVVVFRRADGQPIAARLSDDPHDVVPAGWYRGLYGTSQWKSIAENYENVFGAAIGRGPESVAAVRQALKALPGEYKVSLDPDRSELTSDQLMAAFDKAVAGRRGESTITIAANSAAHEEFSARRGFVLSKGRFRSFKPLIDALLSLRLPAETRDAFVAALVGWALTNGSHTLVEILTDLQRADKVFTNDTELSSAIAGDAVHLYTFADARFAPRNQASSARTAEELRLPQHQAYAHRTQWLASQQPGAAQTAADPAHATALFLLGSEADAPLLDPRLLAGGRKALLTALHQAMDRARAGDAAGFPLLLRQDQRFRDLTRDAAHVSPADSRFDRIRARLHDRAERLSDGLYDEIPLHLAMAAEARRTLPPVRKPAYFAFLAPAEGTSTALRSLNVNPTQWLRATPQAALDKLGHVQDPARRVLVAVENSSAGAIGEDDLRYPAAVDLSVEPQEPGSDSGGRPFEMLKAVEMPRTGPGDAVRLVARVAAPTSDDGDSTGDEEPESASARPVAGSAGTAQTGAVHTVHSGQEHSNRAQARTTSRGGANTARLTAPPPSRRAGAPLEPIPENPSAPASFSTPRPVWIGQDLDERRPARLDPDMPPASAYVGTAAEDLLAPLPGTNVLTQSSVDEQPVLMSPPATTSDESRSVVHRAARNAAPASEESPADRRWNAGPEPAGGGSDPRLTNAPAALPLRAPGHTASQQAGPSHAPAAHTSDPMVRFPDLYFGDRRTWLRTALDFEHAIGRALSASTLLLIAAQRALLTLRNRLVVGPADYRLFFPPGQLTDSAAHAAFGQLVSVRNFPALSAVMEAIARGAAVHARNRQLPGPAPADPGLTARLTELGHPLVDERVAEKAERIREAELVMRVYQDLNVPKGDPLVFRDAVLGWMLSEDPAPTLAELLGAAQRAGIADKDGAQPLEPDLRTVSSVEADASQLYEPGGGYGTWYLDLTNTTNRTCTDVH